MNPKFSMALRCIALPLIFLFSACGKLSTEEKTVQVAPLDKTELTTTVNIFMDEWHEDAANGRQAFFQKIADNGVYIGTDTSELWEKKAFQIWSKKYFDRGKAWDFTPLERNVYFSEDGQYAWFDELLDTWMGICRSSGVLHHTSDGWKIEHYHLAVTLPNDAAQKFIQLIKEYESKVGADSSGVH